MIRFPYRERKTAQAAAHLLALNGGEMHYLLLIKLLYLADRHALINVGRPITGDWLVSMDYGPVLSQTLTLISPGVNPDNGVGHDWYEYISEPTADKKVGPLKQNAESDELSESDLDTLGHIFETYGGWDRWKLSKWTHTLPEWRDPHGSSLQIAPETILREAGKSEEDVERIRNDGEEALFVRQFLVAR